jgi:hypothetical protein
MVNVHGVMFGGCCGVVDVHRAITAESNIGYASGLEMERDLPKWFHYQVIYCLICPGHRIL